MGGHRLAALALALLCAGCVDLGAHDAAPATILPAHAGIAAQLDYAPADATPPPGSGYAMDLPDVWLRPYQQANATVDAPGAAIAWYAGIVGDPLRATRIGGETYLGRDVTRNRTLGTRDIEPGAAETLRLGPEGREVFTSRHAPSMLATVTLDANATDGSARIYMVGDRNAPRFVPDAITLRPGGLVTFVNKANATLDANEREFLARIPSDAARLVFHPVELGVYDLVATARGGPHGDGEARGRFLADFDRPNTHLDFAPIVGRSASAAAPDPFATSEPQALPAALPIRELRIGVRLTTQVPNAAPSIRVQLRQDGRPLLDALAKDGARFTLTDLPPGRLTLSAQPATGFLVDYNVTGDLDMRLPIPDALR